MSAHCLVCQAPEGRCYCYAGDGFVSLTQLASGNERRLSRCRSCGGFFAAPWSVTARKCQTCDKADSLLAPPDTRPRGDG